jgi:hypothetical protein
MLKLPDGRTYPIKGYSMAGLIPLFAIAVADPRALAGFKDFSQRYRWFADNRPDLLGCVADMNHRGVQQRIRLALVDSHKLARLLERVLDERYMLSPHGVRSVSKRHQNEPFVLDLEGQRFTLDYEPGESLSGMFGGNSNWRGPVWFPLNFLLIESLQKHHYFHGDQFKVSEPAGSGHSATLWRVTSDLSQRLIALFTRGADGRRPAHGRYEKFQTDPHWKDLILFYEFFHGDTGAGLGASHQTGWTGLVAKLIHQHAEYTLRHRGAQASEEWKFEGKTDTPP